MGGPSSRSTRGREDAIETLIDMDPNGSAFRVAKTMVSIELYGNFFIGCHVYVCLSMLLKRLLALLFCWLLLHYYTALSVYVFILEIYRLYYIYIIYLICILQHYP